MRIFYAECETQYGLDLIHKLQTSSELDIVWAGSHMKTWKLDVLKKKPSFDTINVLDSKTLYKRSILRECHQDVFVRIDKPVLDYFVEIEQDFYTLTDRSNFKSVTFRERKRYFRDLIRFWIGFLQKEKIDGVYFPYAPHVAWGLVLYQAARYLGVKCYYFSHTAINNRSLIRTNFHEIERVPDEYLQDYSLESLKQEIPQDLLEDFYADSIVTNAVISENDEFNKQTINIKNIQMDTVNKKSERSFKMKVRAKVGGLYKELFKRDERVHFLPLAMDEDSTRKTWKNEGRKHDAVAKKTKEYYDLNAKNVDLSAHYVYFAMHLQPEQTTQPEAGVFEDHLLVLETIVSALPDDFFVYVKENPRQFDTSINRVSAQHFRDITDLREYIATSDKVKLLPQSSRTDDLIENAYVCVTQTGTVGWECLTSGKPCITFGLPWYSGCGSCLDVTNVDEFGKALTAVKSHTPEIVKINVLKYLHYYQDKLFIGSLSDPTNVPYNTVPYTDLIKGHAQEIITKYNV